KRRISRQLARSFASLRMTMGPRVDRARALVALLFSIVWAIPLVWGVGTAFRDPGDAVSNGVLWTQPPSLQGFAAAWDAAPFPTYYGTALIMVGGILAVQLVTITLAGYAFGRLSFPGKGLLFALFLVQMMLPASALVVPNYESMRLLNLIDNRLAIML